MAIRKKKVLKIILGLAITIVLFNVISIIGVHIAYTKVFSRADYDKYNSKYCYKYGEIDTEKYKRRVLSITSGKNKLSAYLYGQDNGKGLIIISPGHRDASDIKLPEITYFVDKGWRVLCYDYTGCYGSEGSNMVGYIQAPKDLDAVLDYVEKDSRFDGLPIMLFGHSLGGYASTAVLQYGHDITSVVAASGFDSPMEQWGYSIKRYTGILGDIMGQYGKVYIRVKFGNMARFSAINGINSTSIPVLLMQGTTDEFYGNVSSIYEHRDKISNSNCIIRVMDKENHHGHYDYFLSDAAVTYRKDVASGKVDKNKPIDKFLYEDINNETMDYINDFFVNSLPD